MKQRKSLMSDDPKKAAVVPLPGAPTPSVPDELLDVTAQDAGLGVSRDPADLILPLITVLQQNSPQCEKRDPAYINGAEPSCFWFRNDLIPIRDGVAGFICIPCDMDTVWLEWGPTRGSGLLGRHLEQPTDVEVRDNPRVANGNSWSVAAVATPCSRPGNSTFSSTASRTC
jgi:hypothetical protein